MSLLAAAILLQAASPWLLSFTPLMCCQLVSCFLLSSINSATTFLTSHSTCSWGEIPETETRPRPTVRTAHNHLRSLISWQTISRPGFPYDLLHFFSVRLFIYSITVLFEKFEKLVLFSHFSFIQLYTSTSVHPRGNYVRFTALHLFEWLFTFSCGM